MGMLPIDSVQEFDAFPVVPAETFQYYDETKTRISFISDTRIHYTQASLIDSLGVRVPDFQHSQKQFKALFVVLSKQPLTPSTIICPNAFRIYNLSGQDVTEHNGSLSSGLYIVRTAEGVEKVMLP